MPLSRCSEISTVIFVIDDNQGLRPCSRPQTSIDVVVQLDFLLQWCCNREQDTTVQSRPTRTAQSLTAKTIEAMKPSETAYRAPDLRCKGLALRVATDGGKTWDLGFRIKGAGVRRLSLGRYEDVGLEAARNRANELTSAARQGRDLIAEEEAVREERTQSYSVERLISEYMRRRVTGRLRTAGE